MIITVIVTKPEIVINGIDLRKPANFGGLNVIYYTLFFFKKFVIYN